MSKGRCTVGIQMKNTRINSVLGTRDCMRVCLRGKKGKGGPGPSRGLWSPSERGEVVLWWRRPARFCCEDPAQDSGPGPHTCRVFITTGTDRKSHQGVARAQGPVPGKLCDVSAPQRPHLGVGAEGITLAPWVLSGWPSWTRSGQHKVSI